MNRSDSENDEVGLIRQDESISPLICPEKAVYISDENVFNHNEKNSKHRAQLRKHKAWLEIIQHEYPLPYRKFKIGVYIRYYNQTKYDNYLDYHKKQFIDTISLCPNWQLVDFYIDTGISAPSMESSPEWCMLIEDCFAGKVNLIVTQKTSNVSRRPEELAFISRILAAQRNPVGIYFISEDLYTLASYYQADLHETDFLPVGWQILPDDDIDIPVIMQGGDDTHATSDD